MDMHWIDHDNGDPVQLKLLESRDFGMLTEPARPGLRWRCASSPSIRSGRETAESETRRELPRACPVLSIEDIRAALIGVRGGSTDLDVAQQIVLDRSESRRAKDIYQRRVLVSKINYAGLSIVLLTKKAHQGLGGLEELSGRDGVVIGGVNWDVREGLLDGVEPGTSSGNLSHDCRCN